MFSENWGKKKMLPWNPKRSMREGTILHSNPKSFITYITAKKKKKGNIIEVGNIHEMFKKLNDQNVAHLLT